jgi:hypothetical protein
MVSMSSLLHLRRSSVSAGFTQGLLSFCAVALFFASPGATEEIAGVFGTVRTLAVYKGDLIAGGDFVTANAPGGGDVVVNHIARWDGAQWRPLGSGTNAPVHALTVLGDSLIVGGEFDQIGSLVVGHIAWWDGSVWSSLGVGMNGPVYALTTQLDLFVFAGGEFSRAGGAPALGVARWFANTWKSVGTGLEGKVKSLAISRGRLIAAGDIQLPGASAADSRILAYAGNWAGLNPAADGPFNVAQDMDGTLVAGGRFRWIWWQTNGYSVGREVGNRWQPLSLGMWNGSTRDTAEVHTMAHYAGGMAAGGVFDHADGLPANNVAWLDGTWKHLGDATPGGGTNGEVLALVEYNQKLVVGGEFTRVDGQETRNIAAWNGTDWNDPLTPVTLSSVLIEAYDDRVHLEWRLDGADIGELRGVVVERATAASGPYASRSGSLQPTTRMSWTDSEIERGTTSWYRLRLDSRKGRSSTSSPIRVEAAGQRVPNALDATDPGGDEPIQIRYGIATAQEHVSLAVYDATGRRVQLLQSGAAKAGAYVQTWDRTDARGRSVSRGVYFIALRVGTERLTHKLVLLSR